MLRILLVLLLAYTAYRIFRNIRAVTAARAHPPSASRGTTAPGELVPCVTCGTFVLKSNAVMRGDSYYCSEQCMST